MTAQEAIEMIRNDMRLHHDHLSGTYRKALKLAIYALEKQIPMRPLPYEMGLDGKIEIPCGKCGSTLDGVWDYCPYCGQSILWRRKNDSTRSKTTP